MDFIKYEITGQVGLVVINRPNALNALNLDVLRELSDTFDSIDLESVRSVIITGAGEKSFVAGADIDYMSSLTKDEAKTFSKFGNDVFRKIELFPLPVIAAVNGYALGGGNELALCCDIRICTDNAIFGQPETSLGITPGFGGTQRLFRAIPTGMAKQLIYSSANIDAKEAYRIGLVNDVYASQSDGKSAKGVMLDEALKLANRISCNAPIAVRSCKESINKGLDMSIDDGILIEEANFSNCFETHDQIEGMSCFLSKERPKPKASFINR